MMVCRKHTYVFNAGEHDEQRRDCGEGGTACGRGQHFATHDGQSSSASDEDRSSADEESVR